MKPTEDGKFLSQDENGNDGEEHAQNRQTVFENITKKARAFGAGGFGNALDHEVRTVADIGDRAKKNRAERNRDEIPLHSRISQKSLHVDWIFKREMVKSECRRQKI